MSAPTNSHRSRTKILTLVATLALAISVVAVLNRRSAARAVLVQLGEVSSIEMVLQGTPASFVHEGDHWRMTTYDSKPAIDGRANQGLLVHLLDLTRALRDETQTALNASEADAYGMRAPELVLKLKWQTPEPGGETVHFGHRDLSGKKVFAYFPDRKLLVEAPAYAVMLLEGKGPLDLRDRHVTTFEVDDIEDLKASGKCGAFSLARDGDRWSRAGKPLAAEKAEQWLRRLLETDYDGLEASGTAVDDAKSNPVCAITLAGRRNRAERLEIFKSRGTLWAKNDKLPGVYHLPTGFLSSLVPP